MRRTSWNVSIAALLLAVGCNEKKPFEGPPEEIGERCTIEGTESFLPLVGGAEWTYVATKLSDETTEEKFQIAGAEEDIGGEKAGIMGFPVTTMKENGNNTTWLEDTGTSIRRHYQEDRAGNTHRNEVFQEYKLRLDYSDERMQEGVSYTESYVETSTKLDPAEVSESSRVEEWSIVQLGEEVTVPAGTFCTVQVRRVTMVDGQPGSDKQYWFARGVGKVKERTTNRREELQSYSIP